MIATAQLETGLRDMAKQRGRPRKSERNDMTVRIERRLATMLKSLAEYHGIAAAELLSGYARPAIERAFAQMMQELEKKGSD
jgi:hypothetical protein